MKVKILLIAIITSLTLLSFNSIRMHKTDKVTEKNTLDINLEEKKAILAEYYSDLIKNEIDKRFNESKDGSINEQEMINAVLAVLPEYGCAYSGTGCTGDPVCGVSMLWAETFGSGSWAGEGGNSCQDVDTDKDVDTDTDTED